MRNPLLCKALLSVLLLGGVSTVSAATPAKTVAALFYMYGENEDFSVYLPSINAVPGFTAIVTKALQFDAPQTVKVFLEDCPIPPADVLYGVCMLTLSSAANYQQIAMVNSLDVDVGAASASAFLAAFPPSLNTTAFTSVFFDVEKSAPTNDDTHNFAGFLSATIPTINSKGLAVGVYLNVNVVNTHLAVSEVFDALISQGSAMKNYVVLPLYNDDNDDGIDRVIDAPKIERAIDMLNNKNVPFMLLVQVSKSAPHRILPLESLTEQLALVEKYKDQPGYVGAMAYGWNDRGTTSTDGNPSDDFLTQFLNMVGSA